MTAANSPLTDVVWNYQYRTDQKAAVLFWRNNSPTSRSWLTNIKSVSKIDEYTVAFRDQFRRILVSVQPRLRDDGQPSAGPRS